MLRVISASALAGAAPLAGILLWLVRAPSPSSTCPGCGQFAAHKRWCPHR